MFLNEKWDFANWVCARDPAWILNTTQILCARKVLRSSSGEVVPEKIAASGILLTFAFHYWHYRLCKWRLWMAVFQFLNRTTPWLVHAQAWNRFEINVQISFRLASVICSGTELSSRLISKVLSATSERNILLDPHKRSNWTLTKSWLFDLPQNFLQMFNFNRGIFS